MATDANTKYKLSDNGRKIINKSTFAYITDYDNITIGEHIQQIMVYIGYFDDGTCSKQDILNGFKDSIMLLQKDLIDITKNKKSKELYDSFSKTRELHEDIFLNLDKYLANAINLKLIEQVMQLKKK